MDSEEHIKKLIEGWQNETPEEQANDINNYLNHVMEKNKDSIKEEAKRQCIRMDDLIQFELIAEKKNTVQKIEKYEFNKPFAKIIKKIKKSIEKKNKKKKLLK